MISIAKLVSVAATMASVSDAARVCHSRCTDAAYASQCTVDGVRIATELCCPEDWVLFGDGSGCMDPAASDRVAGKTACYTYGNGANCANRPYLCPSARAQLPKCKALHKDRWWWLGAPGADCRTACREHGSSYLPVSPTLSSSNASADSASESEGVLPKIAGALGIPLPERQSQRGEQDCLVWGTAWHPGRRSAGGAGDPLDPTGTYSHTDCQLACPCATDTIDSALGVDALKTSTAYTAFGDRNAAAAIMHDTTHGFSWGADGERELDGWWRMAFVYLQPPADAVAVTVTFSAFHDTPSRGLGKMEIEIARPVEQEAADPNAHTEDILKIRDAHSSGNTGQSLTVLGVRKWLYVAKDIVARVERLPLSKEARDQGVRIGMAGHKDYPYARRFIKRVVWDRPTSKHANLLRYSSFDARCSPVLSGSCGAKALAWNHDAYNTAIGWDEAASAPPQGSAAAATPVIGTTVSDRGFIFDYTGDDALMMPGATYEASVWVKTNQSDGNIEIEAYFTDVGRAEPASAWRFGTPRLGAGLEAHHSKHHVAASDGWKLLRWRFVNSDRTQMSFRYRGQTGRLWLSAPYLRAYSDGDADYSGWRRVLLKSAGSGAGVRAFGADSRGTPWTAASLQADLGVGDPGRTFDYLVSSNARSVTAGETWVLRNATIPVGVDSLARWVNVLNGVAPNGSAWSADHDSRTYVCHPY